jgi:hypothetical protein
MTGSSIIYHRSSVNSDVMYNYSITINNVETSKNTHGSSDVLVNSTVSVLTNGGIASTLILHPHYSSNSAIAIQTSCTLCSPLSSHVLDASR